MSSAGPAIVPLDPLCAGSEPLALAPFRDGALVPLRVLLPPSLIKCPLGSLSRRPLRALRRQDRRPARRWPVRSLDLVRLALGQAVERRDALELLAHRALRELDHGVAALSAHPVAPHERQVLCRRLDQHHLGPACTHLLCLIPESPPASTARDLVQAIERVAQHALGE